MKAIYILLVGLLAASSAFWLKKNIQKHRSVEKSILAKYALWKSQFGKLYASPNEDQYRLSVFASNVETIDNMNVKYDTYLQNMGQSALKEPMFVLQADSDLSGEEFKVLKTGLSVPDASQIELEQESEAIFDTKIALGQATYVHRVRSQKSCGSCWAFSVVATLEKMYFDLNGVQVDLSQQYLVDCSTYDNGCSGGWPANTYYWVKNNDIVQSSLYPYVAVRGPCRRSQFTPQQFAQLAPQTTSKGKGWNFELAVTLAKAGVSIGAQVAASGGFRFVNKNDDVFDPRALNECSSAINHGINIIKTSGDYVVVQNSWGISWGNNGFKKIRPCASSLMGVPSYLTHTYTSL
jgi:Papain family cysteine protease/Cathepsin propeptide inhibitor domain (I29)